MSSPIHQFNWNEFRSKLLGGWTKRHSDQFTRINNVHEQSISLLQKRYGYSRQEAIYQLEKYYPNARLGEKKIE